MKRLGSKKRRQKIETRARDNIHEADRDASQIPPVSAEHLKGVLESHKKWISSAKSEGEKANLEGADLRGAELEGVNLREANLAGANLQDAKLDKANLQEASLERADLSGASLVGANLFKASFREALLDNADLTNAGGLLAGQFAGARLANAKLPDHVSKFEGLAVADETSKAAQNLFLTLLLVCVYSWLTISTTIDVKLVTNSVSSPLPIIGASIPIVTFYVVSPLILVVLYIHFNIYLQRLWEALAELPAVFPDGRLLDRRISPWLLTGLVRANLRLLGDSSLPLLGLQLLTSMLLAWWLVPLTLFLLWLRYLSAHDMSVTSLHVLLLSISVGAGITLHRLAVSTLRGETATSFRWWRFWENVRVQNYGGGLTIFLFFIFLSYGITWGVRYSHPRHFFDNDLSNVEIEEASSSEEQSTKLERWAPLLLSFIGSDPFPDFRNEEVSTKPPSWSGLKEEELDYVKGPRLSKKYLRFLMADNAFLVKAVFDYCNLQRAEFEGTDLRKADLQYADLRWANFYKAKLGKANLKSADLRRALLWSADLSGATLEDTKLDGARLLGANLTEATLKRANLRWGDLRFADFSRADLLGATLDHANLYLAKLSGADLTFVDLSSIEGDPFFDFKGSKLAHAKLPKNFTRKTLEGADLSWADLSGVNLSDTDLKDAKLEGANFQEANLSKTDLRGVDLSKAINLTAEQLKEARMDDKTKLPTLLAKSQLKRPKPVRAD